LFIWAGKTGGRLSVDHHSQGAALITIILVTFLLRDFRLLLAFLGYGIMSFSFGGSGTFQRSLRSDKDPGFFDLMLLILGVASLAAMAIIIIQDLLTLLGLLKKH